MPHRMKIKIYYEDTDAAGIVYYANYLRHLERARTEFMLEQGIDIAEYHGRGFIFAITHVDIRYKRPAKLGETVEITTEIAERRNARIVLKSHIVRDGVLLAEAYVTFACLDREGKPRRFPEVFRSLPGAAPAA
ncbi:MAG: YbgC/FadM family acyl-CoA thioesterase [Nitrospirales bacterium]|nr:YbgC/FadM family acyl-CoA thioesterase [Nitrospirales bacterium]